MKVVSKCRSKALINASAVLLKNIRKKSNKNEIRPAAVNGGANVSFVMELANQTDSIAMKTESSAAIFARRSLLSF